LVITLKNVLFGEIDAYTSEYAIGGAAGDASSDDRGVQHTKLTYC
jgi:hypothetical protein